jgi:ribose transport system permease protein
MATHGATMTVSPRLLRTRRIARDYAIFAVFVGLFLFLAATVEGFLTQANLANILDQEAPVLIVGAGATLVIVSGGFDLSVGAVFAASGIVAVAVANETTPLVGVLAAIAAGAAIGFANGAIVTAGGVHSFLGTLASSLVIRGLLLAIAGGVLVVAADDSFENVARSELFGLRSAVYIAVGFVVLAAVVLHLTRLGHAIFAVGGNAEAARVAGLRVQWIRAVTFAISGASAGLAGLIASSRVGGGQAGSGVGLEFTAITAVVLGGTSIYGGEGAVWRTVVGVLLLGFIENGFNLSQVDPVYQEFVVGGALLLAIAINARTARDR